MSTENLTLMKKFLVMLGIRKKAPATFNQQQNIENLTYAELKQIAAMFQPDHQAQDKPHPFVGKYVIARCYAAGVHAGEVVSAESDNVILKDSRRLWSWKAKDGLALSGVAQNGIKSDSKVDTMNPLIYLTGVCELIVCSDAAKKSICNE